jgi:hypothetical protein
MILFNAVMCMFIGWVADSYMLLSQPLIFSFIYTWSKLEPDKEVKMYGQALWSRNMPWVLIVFSLVTGGNLFEDFIGVGAGHMYYFLTRVLPESHGHHLLKTPEWIK